MSLMPCRSQRRTTSRARGYGNSEFTPSPVMWRNHIDEIEAWNAAQDRAKRAYYGPERSTTEDAARRAKAAAAQAEYRRRKKEQAG